jgi:hypothetical protein
MKLHTIQTSPSTTYFLSPRSKHSPRYHILRTIIPRLSLGAKSQWWDANILSVSQEIHYLAWNPKFRYSVHRDNINDDPFVPQELDTFGAVVKLGIHYFCLFWAFWY